MQPVQRRLIPPNREALAVHIPQRREIVELYRQRIPLQDIREHYNISRPTLWRILKKNAIPLRRPNLVVTKPIIRSMRRCYLVLGWSIPKMAEMFHCTKKKIRQIFAENNIQIRGRGRKVKRK